MSTKSRMKRYRSRMDIIADILTTCESGARKTQIMYQANLSYKLLQRYLDSLIEEELLTRKGNLYITNEKGKDYLETYGKLTKPTPVEKRKPTAPLTAEFLATYRKLLKPKAEET